MYSNAEYVLTDNVRPDSIPINILPPPQILRWRIGEITSNLKHNVYNYGIQCKIHNQCWLWTTEAWRPRPRNAFCYTAGFVKAGHNNYCSDRGFQQSVYRSYVILCPDSTDPAVSNRMRFRHPCLLSLNATSSVAKLCTLKNQPDWGPAYVVASFPVQWTLLSKSTDK